MPILNWFDQHSGAVQAIATITYVFVSLGLWIATWRNARHTRDLARDSAGALNLQAVATYLQNAPDLGGGVRAGRLITAPRARADVVETLLSELAPHQWTAIQRIRRAIAERWERGQAAPE
ncbi:MAG: hypothetical protein ABSD47_04895 [Candidatus Methylomirabilota bacterium]|jgi:hypothetical protein